MCETDLKSLAIKLTNRCNLKCLMCEQHSRKLNKGAHDEKSAQDMDLELFRKIIKEYRELPGSGFKSVMPQFRGEPLVDKRFIDVCEMLEEIRLHFGFSTNATLLTKDITDCLIKFKYFRSINFSIDGLAAQTYEKIRLGAKYETVMENIRYFMEAVKARPNIGVKITFVSQELNRNEEKDFIRYWHDKAYIAINTLCIGGRPVSYFWKPERIPCKRLFNNMIVLADGRVIPCCRDNGDEFDLGNLGDSSLAEIWNSPEYEAMREAQLLGDYGRFPMCASCDTWMTDVPHHNEELLDGHILMRRHPFTLNIPRAN